MPIHKNLHEYQLRDVVHIHVTHQNNDIDVPRCRLVKTYNSYPSRARRLCSILPAHLKLLEYVKMEAALRRIFMDKPIYSLNEVNTFFVLHALYCIL